MAFVVENVLHSRVEETFDIFRREMVNVLRHKHEALTLVSSRGGSSWSKTKQGRNGKKVRTDHDLKLLIGSLIDFAKRAGNSLVDGLVRKSLGRVFCKGCLSCKASNLIALDKVETFELTVIPGDRLRESPILLLLHFHNALREELGDLRRTVAEALDSRTYGPDLIQELRRRFEFLKLVNRYHSVAEDEVIFRALDVHVKNVVSAYTLEHTSTNDILESIFHKLMFEKEELKKVFQAISRACLLHRYIADQHLQTHGQRRRTEQATPGDFDKYGKGSLFLNGRANLRKILEVYKSEGHCGEPMKPENEHPLSNSTAQYNPLGGAQLWHNSYHKDLLEVLDELFSIQDSNDLSGLAPAIVQLKFFADVIIFYR
ncbi:zinc finger protein BRUTUS-like protein isoform X1 [Tanacetum coccineum]